MRFLLLVVLWVFNTAAVFILLAAFVGGFIAFLEAMNYSFPHIAPMDTLILLIPAGFLGLILSNALLMSKNNSGNGGTA